MEILKAATSKYPLNDIRTKWPNIQTSPHISDLKSKINSPGQARNKILKTNNYNNQWFKLKMSTAQARRQKKLQHPQDLLKKLKSSHGSKNMIFKSIHTYKVHSRLGKMLLIDGIISIGTNTLLILKVLIRKLINCDAKTSSESLPSRRVSLPARPNSVRSAKNILNFVRTSY